MHTRPLERSGTARAHAWRLREYQKKAIPEMRGNVVADRWQGTGASLAITFGSVQALDVVSRQELEHKVGEAVIYEDAVT